MPEERRELVLAYDALVCPQCGNLRSVCSDPAVDHHPHTSTCWAAASQEWGVRRLQSKHDAPDPKSMDLHPLDGVSVWVSQEPPEVDEFA